jgi:ribosomal protein L37E
MSNTFCRNCGNKMEFVGLEPNFCSKCGFNLKTNTSVAQTNTPRKQNRQVNLDETDDEGTDITRTDWDLSKFSLKADLPKSRKLTLKEIVGMGPIQGEDGFQRQGIQEDPQELVKKSLAECAAKGKNFKEVTE